MSRWRVSWDMWPHEWPAPRRTAREYPDEPAARRHLAGLRAIEAPHPPRPCGDHVWAIRLERQETTAWTEADP
ncbi:MAG: hypothetical protein ACREN5_01220 [Gemmatimonadales bacterium]